MTQFPYPTVFSKDIKLVIPACNTVALDAVESLSAILYECALNVACHALSESTIFDVSHDSCSCVQCLHIVWMGWFVVEDKNQYV